MDTIVDDCNNVLAILQEVAVNSLQVIDATLSLFTEKRACVWFRRWSNINLPVSANTVPQDHAGFTVVLSDVTTRLQNAEALLPVIASHYEADKERKR